MSEPTETNAQPTLDAAENNTGAENTGAATQTESTEAKPEKTFTQADVDRIVQNRLKSAVKAELKKLSQDGETPTIEELQQQLSEAKNKTRTYEANESIRDYLSDPRNKLSANPQDVSGIVALASMHLQYDEQGQITNLKEAVERVKNQAPSLFATTSANINQGVAKPTTVSDMNAFIRQQAGR